MTLTNAYTSTEAVKAELSINDPIDDLKLERSINAASRQIDGHCGWRFWQDSAVVARTFRPACSDRLYLLDESGDDAGISTTAGLIVKLDTSDSGTFGTTLTMNTDFILEPLNAGARVPAWPYTEIVLTGASYWLTRSSYNRPTVQVTAKWGWPAVPDDITKACIVQSLQLFKSKDAVFGAVALGDTGFSTRVRSALNPIAAALCDPYTIPAIG